MHEIPIEHRMPADGSIAALCGWWCGCSWAPYHCGGEAEDDEGDGQVVVHGGHLKPGAAAGSQVSRGPQPFGRHQGWIPEEVQDGSPQVHGLQSSITVAHEPVAAPPCVCHEVLLGQVWTGKVGWAFCLCIGWAAETPQAYIVGYSANRLVTWGWHTSITVIQSKLLVGKATMHCGTRSIVRTYATGLGQLAITAFHNAHQAVTRESALRSTMEASTCLPSASAGGVCSKQPR